MRHILILSLTMVALSGFGGIHSLTHNCKDVRRHNEKMNIVTNGGAKVVLAGDSITHFWEAGHGLAQCKKYFAEGDWKMLDLGTSGDRTEDLLWRFNEGKELDGYEAKIIFLMIGTNNAGMGPWCQEPVADTIFGIREVLKTMREKQPNATIVLEPIFPRGPNRQDWARARHEAVNKEIMKFADGQKILWLDFTDQFLTLEGDLSPELFPDYLHPNGAGYEIWFTAMKPYIDAALSDGKIPMPPSRYAPFLRKGVVRTTEAPACYPMSRIDGWSNWWTERLLRNRNIIGDSQGGNGNIELKGDFDLIMLGDSITHNWEGPGRESLAELRKTYSVIDAGYSGDRTENLLWRIKFGGELDGCRAKVITLMIGTTNAWHRNDPANETAAAIKEILALIAEKQPEAKVLLMPIFPIGSSDKDLRRIRNEEVNKLIKPLADGKKVVWLDFNAKFLDEKGDNVKWMPDHCHPNAAGYKEIWLPAILPYLKETCGK